MDKKKMLSLFSGGGGMDIGFEGGFEVLKHTINNEMCSDWIDKENEIYYTLKENIFETVFANDIVNYAKLAWSDYFSKKHQKDVSNIYHLKSIVDIVKEYKSGNSNIFPDDIDIVTGGFPCQDFSYSGKRNGFNSHKDHKGNHITDTIPTEETRGKLYIWMKNVIEVTLPKVFIAENVKGLSNLSDVKNVIQSDFSNIGGDGYIVLDPQILHAGRYGVPQSRERIFFIGFKKSALSKDALIHLSEQSISEDYSPYPKPTHMLANEELSLFGDRLLANFVKCKDVLLDLPEPYNSNDICQNSYSKAKFMGDHCQGQKEINLDYLAPTIRSEHHGNIEFRRLNEKNGGKYMDELNKGMMERRLTLRECARIQTFPDNYNFVIANDLEKIKYKVSPSSGYKLVGNAVPPLLAYHIARNIQNKWNLYFI